MRRMETIRRQPAIVVAAALLLACQGGLAQAPIGTPAQATEQAAPGKVPGTVSGNAGGQAASPGIPAQPQAAVTLPVIQATPEQVGDALMAHQRYQAAIAAYSNAPKDSATVWNKMGIANQMMFNLDGAEHCYKASLKLNPNDPNVLNNMGTVYDGLKTYALAEHMYRKALKLEPGSALIEKNLGTTLLAQHKYKKGWAEYQAALKIDPTIFNRHDSPQVENVASLEGRGAMNYYMAKGCVKAGMNDRAIEYLRMALNEGFTNAKKINADTEFSRLHGLPAFQQLLASQSTQ